MLTAQVGRGWGGATKRHCTSLWNWGEMLFFIFELHFFVKRQRYVLIIIFFCQSGLNRYLSFFISSFNSPMDINPTVLINSNSTYCTYSHNAMKGFPWYRQIAQCSFELPLTARCFSPPPPGSESQPAHVSCQWPGTRYSNFFQHIHWLVMI